MREGRPSGTAAFVTLLRALGDRGLTTAQGFRDPTARALLPPPWARALDWLAPTIALFPAVARERVVERVDLLVVRTRAIDAELTGALATGADQVVILGAGFDGRAHRMTALQRAHVFEVDHPATQVMKRRLSAGRTRMSGDLTYVACDFLHDALDERLRSAGHDVDRPTVWIWEGVTLYLDDDAIRETLTTIASRSSTGSALIVDYHDADATTHDPVYAFARKILLRLWSEPHIGARPRKQMRGELEAAGLKLERDFGLSEWGGTRFERPRIAVASLTRPRSTPASEASR
jgi:methyltransferase (TIGR00027 family)